MIWRGSLLAPEPGIDRGRQGHRVQRQTPVTHHHYMQIKKHTNNLYVSPVPPKQDADLWGTWQVKWNQMR